jgi:orotidine-5'-phosphate decarboxylase
MHTDQKRKIHMHKVPIVLAVDTSALATAIQWVKATQDHVSVYKLGLEFYLTFGSDGVKAIKDVTDSDIFLTAVFDCPCIWWFGDDKGGR